MNFDQSVVSSFKERLEHEVAKKLSAFKNGSFPLFLDSEHKIKNSVVYSAGTRQFIYDSSIPGANIIDLSEYAGTSWENAKVDYRNSRLIFTGTPSGAAPTSITASEKHFNFYVSSFPDEVLFNKVQFGKKPEKITQSSSVLEDSFYGPCVFVKLGKTFNEGLALGGEDMTRYNIKVTCFSPSEAELVAIGGVIRDLKNTTTYILDSTPLNEYNDLKEKPWSFLGKMTEMKNLNRKKIHIDDCFFAPLRSDVISSKVQNVFIGVGDFNLFVARSPRQ